MKGRSIALKKKGKEKKENQAKYIEKQKKLKRMRYHQVQPTPHMQPTVDRMLLAAANVQAQAVGGAAVNPVFLHPPGTSGIGIGTTFSINFI